MDERPPRKRSKHLKEGLLFVLSLVAQTVWEAGVKSVSDLLSGAHLAASDVLKVIGVAGWVVAVVVLAALLVREWLREGRAAKAATAPNSPKPHHVESAQTGDKRWSEATALRVLEGLERTGHGGPAFPNVGKVVSKAREPFDSRWSALAKDMAAVMDPYGDLIYRDAGEEHGGSLQSFFSFCLNNPDHDFPRRGKEMTPKDEERMKQRREFYVGWRQGLAFWDGSATHARFLHAMRDLENFSREDFEKAHGLMLECIDHALKLNATFASWLKGHLGHRLFTHQWHDSFAEEFKQFLDRVLDFERKVKVETGVVSPLLRKGYGPLLSSDDRVPFPAAIP